MSVCMSVFVKITRPQRPRDFANDTLAQDALCCAERKAPLNFRVYFALQSSELAQLLLLGSLLCIPERGAFAW